jgi:hypothetical protein
VLRGFEQEKTSITKSDQVREGRCQGILGIGIHGKGAGVRRRMCVHTPSYLTDVPSHAQGQTDLRFVIVVELISLCMRIGRPPTLQPGKDVDGKNTAR